MNSSDKKPDEGVDLRKQDSGTADSPGRPLSETFRRKKSDKDEGNFIRFLGGSNVGIMAGGIYSVGSMGAEHLNIEPANYKGLERKQSELVDRRDQYLSDLQKEIEKVGKRARNRMIAYRTLRLFMLGASAITPVLALLEAPPVATALVAAFVFVCEGFIQLTRLHDRAALDSRRRTSLSRHYRMFRTVVGPYDGDDSFSDFVRNIEEIREKSDAADLVVIEQTFSTSAEPSTRQRRLRG